MQTRKQVEWPTERAAEPAGYVSMYTHIHVFSYANQDRAWARIIASAMHTA